MRCYICDTELSTQEIQLDEEEDKVLKSQPCSSCLRIIMDTAYCDGFEPYPDEDEVDPTLDDEENQ